MPEPVTLDDILDAVRTATDEQHRFQNSIEIRLTALEQRMGDDDDEDEGEEGERETGANEGEREGDGGERETGANEGERETGANEGERDGGNDGQRGERPMTRAEIRRAARERNGKSRSERYGDHTIRPEGSGPSLNRNGFEGLSVGNLVRGVMSNGAIKDGHREMELLEARQISIRSDEIVIPWDLPAVSGRRAEAVEAKMDQYREVPIHAPHVEQRYDVIRGGRREALHIGSTGHARALSAGTSGAGSGGAMVGVDLDVARSQMWLREMSPEMTYMNPVMGVMSEYQVWYGGVAPQGAAVPEGGGHAENAATLIRMRRDPVPIHFRWSFTGNLLAMDAVGIESLVNDAIESLLMQEVMLNIISGPNTAKVSVTDDTPTFAVAPTVDGVRTSFNGLLNSGIAESTFGANADTALTALDRGDVVSAEESLKTNRAMGENPHWLTSVPVIQYARNKRTGGADSPVYLATPDGQSQWTGMIGGALNGEGSRFVESTLFGKTNGTAFKRTALLAYLYGSQAVPIFFGQGIEIRIFRPTSADEVQYSLVAHVNFAMVNPKNGTIIKQM